MPKIIENLPQKLLEEARRQAAAGGYSAVTVRSVAKACGVGVGTVYNYYASKDALLAASMLEQWHCCTDAIQAAAQTAGDAAPVLECIYHCLQQFIRDNKAIFEDKSASQSFAGSFSQYHSLLRSQLADPLRKFCQGDFEAEFIAEALLTWTAAGKGYEEIKRIMQKIL
jgi:AcrR family transcriptional regulator